MKRATESRREFLALAAASTVGVGVALVLPQHLASKTRPRTEMHAKTQPETQTSAQPQSQAQTPPPSQPPAKPPRLDLELVQAFVRAGHVDLDRTKELLAQEPGLLNATWDWGGGDWETALGGAGHMGRKDIALFLISKGARMDIFHAAMLGRLDIVKDMLTAFPNLAASRGPHGISLMAHAQKGGEESLPVVSYLQSLTPVAS